MSNLVNSNTFLRIVSFLLLGSFGLIFNAHAYEDKPLDLVRNDAANSLLAAKQKAQSLAREMDIDEKEIVAIVVELENSVTQLLQVEIARGCSIDKKYRSTGFDYEAAREFVLCQIEMIEAAEEEIRERFQF